MAALCAIFVTISLWIWISDHVCTAQVCLVMEYAEGGSLYNGKSTLISLLVIGSGSVFYSAATTLSSHPFWINVYTVRFIAA